MKTLHYYFALISPFSYLGHEEFREIVDRDDVTVAFHPLQVGPLFAATGGVAPSKRSPQRQSMRLAELRRWSERKEIALNLQPAHFPVNEALAARCIMTLTQDGVMPWDFIHRAHRVVWAEDGNLSDPAKVEEILTTAGHDATAVMATAQTDAIGAAYDACTEAAIETGVFGAPTFLIEDELFWGQDRLDWVEAVLNA